MISTAITWSSIHQNGDLWVQHLKIRKKLFVDCKGWTVPHNTEYEWDQYDTGNTHYVITSDGSAVVAASRINPCDFESGTSSYMIRDAVLGRLPMLPTGMLETPPITRNTWEATRFAVDPTLDRDMKDQALAENAIALANHAGAIGARQLIAMMHPAFSRWLTRIGLKTIPIGPTKLDAPVWVAGLNRYGWPDAIGIGGRVTPECTTDPTSKHYPSTVDIHLIR